MDWVQALRVYSLTPLPVLFHCFLCAEEGVISWLSAPVSGCHTFATVMDFPSVTISQNKLSSKVAYDHGILS